MAKMLCTYSGLELSVSHFPLYAGANESCHPIFEFESHKLIPFYESLYLENRLDETEIYLYYLALWKSTGFVDFRNAALMSPAAVSVAVNTLHDLVQMVQRIQILGEERCRTVLDLPRFIISYETRDLSCCEDWLRIWEDNYKDYQQGYRTTTAIEKITRLESSLERNIKSKLKDISSYAGMLANWAEQAANFPTYEIANEHDAPEALNTYWKRLIVWCATEERTYTLISKPVCYDLEDLIEFCEDNLNHGNIQAHTLMALLRSVKSKTVSINSLGAIDIDATHTYKILKPEDGVEEANMLELILNAPKSEPKESQYPNKLAFLKAKMRWNQACEYYADHPTEHPEYKAIELLENATAIDDGTHPDGSGEGDIA